MRFCLTLILALMLAGCGGSGARGPIGVAIIGDSDSLSQQGVRLSPAAQHLRGATHEGLVALDPTGQVLPGVAERWIVTDDGLSYIFRLRNTDWPDGSPITAGEARQMLRDRIRRLQGTSLGLDLAKIAEVRAMTGRVIEIRLSSPMPDFLRLLAQPELGFSRGSAGAGPMTAESDGEAGAVVLTALPPEMRGMPQREDWEEGFRPLKLSSLSAPRAVKAFADGEVDLVLNGRLAHLPLVDTGPLTRGTIRLDAAMGVFGLAVRSEEGFLANPKRREALSMAIDRAALMQPFNIAGWVASAEIVPRNLWGDVVPEGLVWADSSIERRRAEARRRVSDWVAVNGGEVRVSIGLPPGPGSDQLFQRLQRDLRLIGVNARQVPAGQGADLELYDRVARYASPRWFLNQFSCEVHDGPCEPSADALVEQSLTTIDPEAKASLLARADLALQDANVFIPFGAPIRWALVRGSIEGFEENPWGIHPLFPLAEPTT